MTELAPECCIETAAHHLNAIVNETASQFVDIIEKSQCDSKTKLKLFSLLNDVFNKLEFIGGQIEGEIALSKSLV